MFSKRKSDNGVALFGDNNLNLSYKRDKSRDSNIFDRNGLSSS
jgi:hypothetical protein